MFRYEYLKNQIPNLGVTGSNPVGITNNFRPVLDSWVASHQGERG